MDSCMDCKQAKRGWVYNVSKMLISKIIENIVRKGVKI